MIPASMPYVNIHPETGVVRRFCGDGTWETVPEPEATRLRDKAAFETEVTLQRHADAARKRRLPWPWGDA